MSGPVAFLASQTTQVLMYAPVASELERLNIQSVVLSLDRLYGHDASTAAASVGMRCLEIAAGTSATAGGFYLRGPLRVWKDVLQARRPIESSLGSIEPLALVVGTDRGPIERLVIHVAQQMRIPTVLLQDGRFSERRARRATFTGRSYDMAKVVLSPVLRCLGLPYLAVSDHGSSGVSLICASGPESARFLGERAGHQTAVVITGQPRYDEIIDSWTSRARGSDSGRLVSMFTTPFRAANLGENAQVAQEALALELNRAISAEGGQFILKPHPREDRHRYIDLLGPNAVGPASVRPHEILAKSSAAVIGMSTVLEEAGILMCPVIVPGTIVHGARFESQLPPSAIYPRFESAGEAMRLLHEIWADEAQRSLALQQAERVHEWVSFSQTKRAAVAVAEAVENVLKDPRPSLDTR